MTPDTSELKIGDPLRPLSKTVTKDKIDRFEALGHILRSQGTAVSSLSNIHTDQQKAEERGLGEPVASGQMSFAYLHELLARQFGIDFRQGGQLSVTFLKPVYAGDVLTAHGVITAKELLVHRTKFTVRVWLESQNGVTTSAGEAEVTVPSPLT